MEHLSLQEGIFFIEEVNRILKTEGIIRIVVPDLENLCKEYLNILDIVTNNSEYDKKYAWITIELLDQMVRRTATGEMGRIFNRVKLQEDKQLAEYILHRTGVKLLSDNFNIKKRVLTIDKIINKLLYIYLKTIQFFIPKSLRKLVIINTPIGEKHLWMYDRYSLSKLFEIGGFRNISVEKYNTSKIENFNSYMLDIKDDETPFKGMSSIYMEAKK